MPVSPLENNFYARWRLQCGKTFFLRETNSPLPERLLQVIWFHQRLLRDQLRTLDGKPVRVLHPGFWNHEAGPDFRNAVVQIGDAPAKTGDVEIDLCTDGWKTTATIAIQISEMSFCTSSGNRNPAMQCPRRQWR